MKVDMKKRFEGKEKEFGFCIKELSDLEIAVGPNLEGFQDFQCNTDIHKKTWFALKKYMFPSVVLKM